MDFHTSQMSVFVVTLFVYVATLHLQALLWLCRNISAMSLMFAFCQVCRDKAYECHDISAVS